MERSYRFSFVTARTIVSALTRRLRTEPIIYAIAGQIGYPDSVWITQDYVKNPGVSRVPCKCNNLSSEYCYEYYGC